MTITETLAERGNRYGCFKEHARITQNIKRAMADSPNWGKLSDDKREALEMLAHKVGRILNGDPEWYDSWHDMEGYSRLVAEGLVAESDPLTPQSIINLALKNLSENPPFMGALNTPNDDGWIQWDGKSSIAQPKQRLEVKLRSGAINTYPVSAHDLKWVNYGDPLDIIAYRICEQK